MHHIHYTNKHGAVRHVKLAAAQIVAVMELTKALIAQGIAYTHVFVD